MDLCVQDSSYDLPETPWTMSHESPEGEQYVSQRLEKGTGRLCQCFSRISDFIQVAIHRLAQN